MVVATREDVVVAGRLVADPAIVGSALSGAAGAVSGGEDVETGGDTAVAVSRAVVGAAARDDSTADAVESAVVVHAPSNQSAAANNIDLGHLHGGALRRTDVTGLRWSARAGRVAGCGR